MEKEAIAHLADDGRVHGLEEHLRGTAKLAAEFAAEFGCGEWGRSMVFGIRSRLHDRIFCSFGK